MADIGEIRQRQLAMTQPVLFGPGRQRLGGTARQGLGVALGAGAGNQEQEFAGGLTGAAGGGGGGHDGISGLKGA